MAFLNLDNYIRHIDAFENQQKEKSIQWFTKIHPQNDLTSFSMAIPSSKMVHDIFFTY